MLTAETLVANGVGCKLTMTCKSDIKNTGGLPGFAPLVKEYSGPVYGDLASNVLSLEKSGMAQSNGTFIRNIDDQVTVGLLIRDGFIASDQFGGCDLTILKAPGGQFMGAHVYSSDACREAMKTPPLGWKVVGTWKSTGYAAKWPGNSALFGFAFIGGGKIKFVAMGLKGYPPTVANVELAATVNL
ncbi:MAG TPA: hypothetical protein VIG49_10580 [Acetobacteraceae bacterium]